MQIQKFFNTNTENVGVISSHYEEDIRDSDVLLIGFENSSVLSVRFCPSDILEI